MIEEYEELYNNKEKLREYLEKTRDAVVIGNLRGYKCLFKREKLFLCFSQPSIEELKELMRLEETILFL